MRFVRSPVTTNNGRCYLRFSDGTYVTDQCRFRVSLSGITVPATCLSACSGTTTWNASGNYDHTADLTTFGGVGGCGWGLTEAFWATLTAWTLAGCAGTPTAATVAITTLSTTTTPGTLGLRCIIGADIFYASFLTSTFNPGSGIVLSNEILTPGCGTFGGVTNIAMGSGGTATVTLI